MLFAIARPTWKMMSLLFVLAFGICYYFDAIQEQPYWFYPVAKPDISNWTQKNA
jgi:hypothetical protein